MKRPILLALLFIIGCATGGVASQFVVPPARAGTTPTRWEYLCAEGETGLVEWLNRIGANGWELVSTTPMKTDKGFGTVTTTTAYAFCFKRALP